MVNTNKKVQKNGREKVQGREGRDNSIWMDEFINI